MTYKKDKLAFKSVQCYFKVKQIEKYLEKKRENKFKTGILVYNQII